MFVEDKYVNKTKCRETDADEMTAFLGLLILVGTFIGGKLNVRDILNKNGLRVDIICTYFIQRCL